MFDSLGVANQLVAVVSDLDGIATVQIGAPESIGPRVSAWVSLGGQNTTRKRTAVVRRESRFFVCFCYRVDANEQTAETTLMTIVDAFLNALHADLTLAGTCLALTVDSATADEPDYQLRAGAEYREYPMIVTVQQEGPYTVEV